jgi:16S rRNA (guanine527-N7)-methyltransferase
VSPERSEEILDAGLAEMGLSGSPGPSGDPARENLDLYLQELERWTGRLGLVNAQGRELVIRHILDSLAAHFVISELIADLEEPSIADLGSGGGLPGIPLACYLPNARVHLVERSGRKCGFLRGAVLAARLRNVTVHHCGIAEIGERFNVLVFRAFSPLTDDLLKQLRGLLSPGGTVCAYKGREDRINSEVDGLSADTKSGLSVEIIPVQVPFLNESRNLVVLGPLRSS